MGSKDSGSVKVDGFPNGEGDMSKRPKRKSEQAVTAGVDVQADRVIAMLNDGEYFETDGVAIDPSQVTTEPIPREERTQTPKGFSQGAIEKMAESLGIPVDLPDYESPSYSSAREDAKASQEADKKLDPIREMVASFKQDRLDALMASIPKEGQLHSEPSGEGFPSAIGITYDPWTDTVSRVVRTDASGKVVEDYQPIPREDEARPCSLCESRRPIGKSYSRVYCTKANARYCKCSYCGHTWTQERK
jgi:hypothetical protein